MQKELIKFQPSLKAVGKRPILIVGERPGKQRLGTAEQKAFHGNKSGDFIEEIIKDYGNIVITNAINFQETEFESLNDLILDGAYDLRQLIKKYEPKRIIALGKRARLTIDNITDNGNSSILADDCFVFYLPHPSFVLRFRKDIGMYQKTIETLLKGNKFGTNE